MSEYQCDNCQNSISKSDQNCPTCGYPHQGAKSEQIAYNTKLMRVKDQVEESDKSVKAIFSFSIIFFFMALVVLTFSLIFNEDHFQTAYLFGTIGLVYLLFNRIGGKNAYIMVILALFFYIGHTIFEFSNGIFPKSPVDVDDSFLESRGASLIYLLIPAVYMLFRLALMIVLAKYLLTQLKLRRGGKIVDFVRSKKQV